MSLQYIIDGYNLLNHPLFAQTHKKSRSQHLSLLEFIRAKKPSASRKNQITVVFDGYPPADFKPQEGFSGINVIFSRDVSADEKIKKMLEKAQDPRQITVVSDDKEVKFFARANRAKSLAIEEFAKAAKINAKTSKSDSLKPELSYVQIDKINQELEHLWLK